MFYRYRCLLELQLQVSETKAYDLDDDSDDDDSKKGHINVHIVDIKSAIQRLYLHPRTQWDKARRSDMYRSFSNVPFAQVMSLIAWRNFIDSYNYLIADPAI